MTIYRVPIYSIESFRSRTPIRIITIEGPSLLQLNSQSYLSSIQRGYRVLMSQNRVPYGVTTNGKEYSYFSPKNRGRARLPRSPGLGRAIMVSGTRSGRGVRKPKVRDFTLDLNRRERRAILTRAFFYSFYRQYLDQRGHRFIDFEHPLVFDSWNFTRTSEVNRFFNLDSPLSHELRRSQVTRDRATRGRNRNRRVITRRGPLLLLPRNENRNSVNNLAGIDIISYDSLNIRHFAPGGVPGRFIISIESEFLTFLDVLDIPYDINELDEDDK